MVTYEVRLDTEMIALARAKFKSSNLLSLYLTSDSIGVGSGGGIVTANEIEALKSISTETVVISRGDIIPDKYKQPDSIFLYDYFALNMVRDLVKYKGRPDLVHCYSGTFSQTVHYLKSLGSKISYTIPAHDRKVTVAEFEKLGLVYPFPHIKEDYIWQIFSQGYREADLTIAPSKVSAHFLSLEGCRNVKVIPHGCTRPSKTTPIDTNVKRIGYLGQAGPDKGLIYLLKAWESLDLRDTELVFAGACSEHMKQMIPRTVNKGKYVIKGYVPDVSDFYNNISVLIQPSVCESFGLEPLEAAIHGRPSIVSTGAGVSDLVEDKHNGYIVQPGSAEAIAKAVKDIVDNAYRVEEMGDHARSMAEDYTWDKVRDKYINAWKEMILS